MRQTLLFLPTLVIACGGTAPLSLDASTDARGDAPADATTDGFEASPDTGTCPMLKPSRSTTCPNLDELCLYGCGIAMRCTAKGWDNDLTVDAGPPCP